MSDCRNPIYYGPDGTVMCPDVTVPSLIGSAWVRPSNSLDNSLAWCDINGAINSSALRMNIYIHRENVIDVRLADMECGYAVIYNHLVLEHPAKEVEWELLLKLNSNNYRATVLQIEDSLKNEDVK